jgi:hypothetical protein
MNSSNKVVLRNSRDEKGTRYLEASLRVNGDLVIEGQDLGSGVEDVFGFYEYEWSWAIAAEDVSELLAALGAESDVLSALRERFSGDRAGDLKEFLDAQSIRYASWSRIGD